MTEEEKQFKFQILSFAKDIAYEDYSVRRQKADSEFTMLQDAWREHRTGQMPEYRAPSFITPKELIAMAEEFEKYCSANKKTK